MQRARGLFAIAKLLVFSMMSCDRLSKYLHVISSLVGNNTKLQLQHGISHQHPISVDKQMLTIYHRSRKLRHSTKINQAKFKKKLKNNYKLEISL